jgi:3-oxoadipate enol-lactonase
MAAVEVNGGSIEVLDTGGEGPVVCFSHGLLWDQRMFAPQIAALRGRFRCVAWDHRGQGRSSVPDTRIVEIETVTADAVTLIERLGAPVHFVGLSMGGFVGMRIAARRPELVRSLALLDTAPDPEPREHLPRYRLLTMIARLFGVSGFLADRVLKIMCGPEFLADPRMASRVAELRRMLMENRQSVHKAVGGVLERQGVEDELAAIRCPVLVLRGAGDMAISRERARQTLARVPQAQWVEVARAGHTSTLEEPEAVTAALRTFLDGAEVAAGYPPRLVPP